MEQQAMKEPLSLKQAFQGMMPEAIKILRGTVMSTSPLKIQVINDEKLVLSENIICIPRHLSTYQTMVDITLGNGFIESITCEGQGAHSHPSVSESGEHVHSVNTFHIVGAAMTVHNELREGEIVYILSFNHGKKYYILDREAS